MQVRVGLVVDDQVVDDTAGLVVAAQRVLSPAGPDPVEVVGQAGVDEVLRTGARHLGIAEMAHVEQADRRTDRGVLLHDAGVLDGHLPATELRHACAERNVSIMQRRTSQRGGHDRRRYRIASTVMTTLSLTKTPLSDVKADAIVIGVAKGATGLELAPGAND